MKLNLAFAATVALAVSNNVSANNDDANELIQQEKDLISELSALDLAGTRNEEPAEAANATDNGDLVVDFDEAEAAGAMEGNETAAIMPEMVALTSEEPAATPEMELYDSDLTPELISESPEDMPVVTTVSEGGSSVTGTATTHHHESKHQHKKSEKARAKAEKDAAATAAAAKAHKESHDSMSLPVHKAKAAKAQHSMSLPEQKAKAAKSAKHSKQTKMAKTSKAHHSLSVPTTTDHAHPSKAHKNTSASSTQEYAETVEVLTSSEEDTMDNATVPETKSVQFDTSDGTEATESNADSILAAVSAALSGESQGAGETQPVPRIPDETPDKAIPADKFTQEVKEAMLNGKGSVESGHKGVSTHHMKENVDKLDVSDKPRASNSLASDANANAGSLTSAKEMIGFCLVVSSAMAYAMLV